MKHATPRVKIINKCKYCFRDFFGFYPLRECKTSEHGIKMKSAEFGVNNFLEDDDADLEKELRACQIFLVGCELEEGKHRVSNFAM